MLILMYLYVVNTIIPTVRAYASALYLPSLELIVMVAGIALIFASVGMSIAKNTLSTVLGAIIAALAFIFTTIVRAMGWIIQSMYNMTPRLYRETLNRCEAMGCNAVLSTVLAVLIPALFIIILI